MSCGANDCRIAILVHVDYGRRLQTYVYRKGQRSEGEYTKDRGQEHGAIGVCPKHAVMLVVFRHTRYVHRLARSIIRPQHLPVPILILSSCEVDLSEQLTG